MKTAHTDMEAQAEVSEALIRGLKTEIRERDAEIAQLKKNLSAKVGHYVKTRNERDALEQQIGERDLEIDHLYGVLSDIRLTCLRASEKSDPGSNMVSAGLKAIHLAEETLNSRGKAS